MSDDSWNLGSDYDAVTQQGDGFEYWEVDAAKVLLPQEGPSVTLAGVAELQQACRLLAPEQIDSWPKFVVLYDFDGADPRHLGNAREGRTVRGVPDPANDGFVLVDGGWTLVQEFGAGVGFLPSSFLLPLPPTSSGSSLASHGLQSGTGTADSVLLKVHSPYHSRVPP